MLKKIIDTHGFNAVVKGRYGYITYNKNDIYIGKAIEKYGEFSEAEVELFRQLCVTNDVVVEVGANIGTHTLAFAHIVGNDGRVYAFEPQRIVFQTLCANLALNSITNVECFQVAASAEEGYVLIPEIRYDIEGNFGGVIIQDFNQGNKVPKVKLDTFLDIPRLKLLKIDVEGMEADVLTGATDIITRFKPILYVENDRVDRSKALIELIQSMDYKLYWHLPPLYNPNNFASDPENLYPNIASFNMLCFHNSIDINIEGSNEITDSNFHPLKNKPSNINP